MSGIDTSRGINSVASAVAAFEAEGAQVVTTNLGVQVSGLEAAAYEFGSLLAAYPPNAPTLTLNAEVFRVTDAQGNTTSVSLNDLASDIRRQTGFDPIVEFCAGNAISGFSVSDINAILGQIENQFSSMSFTRLTVVEIDSPLQVSGQLTQAEQAALGQLGNILNTSTPSLTQVVNATPGGLDPNSNVFITPSGLNQVASSQANVSNLNSDLNTNLSTIQSGMVTIQAIQSAVAGGSTVGAPANIVTDAENLRAAQAALNALTNNSAAAALSTFATNLTSGVANVFQRTSFYQQGGGQTILEAPGLMTGARRTTGAQGTADLSLCGYFCYTSGFNGLQDLPEPDQMVSDLIALSTGLKNAFGPEFQAALAASPNGTIDASAPVFRGPSGTLKSFSDVLSDLQAGLPPDFLRLYQQPQGDPRSWGTLVANFNIQRYFASAFGGAVPTSFSASSASTISQAASQAQYTDPTSVWNLDVGTLKGFYGSYSFTNDNGQAQPFSGLMSLCGYNANSASDVTAFNAMLDQIMPGASGKQYWSASDLNTLQLGCARYSVTAAQSLVTQATNKLNADATAAINSAQATITAAQTKVGQDATALTTALSNAMGSTDPALSSLQSQINTLQGQINADQASLSAAQASLNALTNAYANNPGAVLTSAQQAQLATYQQTIISATSDMRQKQASLAGLQNQLIAAAAPHQSLNDILGQLQSSTGLALSEVVQDVVGNGTITPEALNKLYSYINQNQPAGRAALPLIPDSQLSRAGMNAGAPAVPTTASDSLLNYTLPVPVQNALGPVVAAINQLVPGDFDANGNLSFDSPVFSVPSISASPVSLSDIFTAQLQNTGIDFGSMLSGLVTPAAVQGGTATINSTNLSAFIQLLNQALPQGSVNANSIAGILSSNFTNVVTPTLTAVSQTVTAMASLPSLPFSQNSANVKTAANNLAQQVSAWQTSHPMPSLFDANGNFSPNAFYAWKHSRNEAMEGLFLSATGLYAQVDSNYASHLTYVQGNDTAIDTAFQSFKNSPFIQNLQANWGLAPFSNPTVGTPFVERDADYASLGGTGDGANSWFGQVQAALQRQAAGESSPNTQAAAALLGVNPFNNVAAPGTNSLAARLGITIPANPTAADVNSIYQQLQTRVASAAPGFNWPASASQITASTLSSLNSTLQDLSNAANAAQLGVANRLQSTVGNNGNSALISNAVSLAALANAVLAPGVTVPQSTATLNLISFSQQASAYFNSTPNSPQSFNWPFLGAGGIYSQIDPNYQGPTDVNPTDASMAAFAATPFVQDLRRNWGLSDYTHWEQATNYLPGDNQKFNSAWFVGVQQAMQRKINAIQSPNTQAVATLLGTNLFDSVIVPGSLAAQLGLPIPAHPSAADANNIYQQLQTRLASAAPNFSWPASISDLTPATLSTLNQAIQTHLQQLENTNNTFASTQATFSITDAATNLQNLRFESLATAVQSGHASAEVAAAVAQPVDRRAAPTLSAAELNAQLEAGDLYVNSRGQFFLNRQPTNARDAAVAAFVVGGNKLNDKLNDMMNKINLNNTKIQMASYLSAATSVTDLQARIAEQKAQYGFDDILSELTGGALTDASINASTDVSGATGTFQSSLKTAINNATKNQDLDTQSLQSLTSQVQANMTAMTQLIQAFEQMLRSLTQNML